jgi:Uma2 family endonuclease
MSIDVSPGRTAVARPVVYPDSDGQPMAENTLQFRWIVTIEGNLETLYVDVADVFVAGDLLWYPVEGMPAIRMAPDVLIAFGRPKGDRGSYKQWEEGGIAPQVVWEILSPGNRPPEMVRKTLFYERYGVEEFYVYDPDTGEVSGWIRRRDVLEEIPDMNGWVSPRLGIRFQIENGGLVLYKPNGERFLTFLELQKQAEESRRQLEEARQQANQNAQRAAAAEAEAIRLRVLVEELKRQSGQS